MPTYVILFNYTQQGIENIEDSPERHETFVELVEAVGGEEKAFYLTMGPYDLVSICEFPDDDAAARAVLRDCQFGNVTTQTMRAWPTDDFRELVANLP
ncbi:MAG: GYD domain-containing protein [Salinigranum sp.]